MKLEDFTVTDPSFMAVIPYDLELPDLAPPFLTIAEPPKKLGDLPQMAGLGGKRFGDYNWDDLNKYAAARDAYIAMLQTEQAETDKLLADKLAQEELDPGKGN